MAVEVFANSPVTTVVSGGSNAPASWTSQSWTVTSSGSFPAAATGTSQFHVLDPAQSSEIIAVTNVSGTTWTVTRGAESTTPVTHASGFTVYQVVTAGFLNSLGIAPSGDTTGVKDTATIQAALNAYSPVLLAPGNFYTNAPLQVSAGS